MLLAGIVTFLAPGTAIQLAAAFTIAFVFLLFHDVVCPYVDPSEDNLQRYAMIAITMTLFGGILRTRNPIVESS